MLTKVLAWLGLIAVLLLAAQWLLEALGRRLSFPAPLRGVSRMLTWLARPFDPDLRAERRRQQRVQVAKLQRDAIARASAPMPLDPPVSWDGNVARPQFGQKSSQAGLH